MNRAPIPELFRHFPGLRRSLPWVPLAQPTPVEALRRLESHVRGPGIWIKRDDRTSPVHGGARARKLEFLFGDVLRRGARQLLAFGPVDSRDCLAVAAFARHFRLRTLLALRGGAAAALTLRQERELGAELHRVDAGPRALWRLLRSCLGGLEDDHGSRLPYILWRRRTALFGALGYVNAAYELRRQIACGVLPEPECIYVSVATGATLAGLALGCELAGVRSRLVGVVARGERPAPPGRLARRATQYLRRRAGDVPAVVWRGNVELHPGDGAARSAAARDLLHDLEGIELDPATTAPVMAELLAECRRGDIVGPVLFWNTDAPEALAAAEALPWELRELFPAR